MKIREGATFEVLALIGFETSENSTSPSWVPIGKAVTNPDGAISVYLNVYPTNVQEIQLLPDPINASD